LGDYQVGRLRSTNSGPVRAGIRCSLWLGSLGSARARSRDRTPLQLFQQARALQVTVFFITGRPESQRAATERNLVAAGYHGYERLYMVPEGAHFASATDFKAPVRLEIEQAGYTIVANVGDQPSDVQGGHAEKSFLLPDPFYRVP
jgi:HAD superfamily, subfamily IIIB (Acid phosphatase)